MARAQMARNMPKSYQFGTDVHLDQGCDAVNAFARRHYEAMAEAMRGVQRHLEWKLPPDKAQEIYEMVVAQVALVLAHDNKQFDSFKPRRK